jgi:cAMP phosphodiesterase
MRFNLLITCLMPVFLVSCKYKQPEGVLSEQEMVRVLMEIYIDEEKISRAYIPYDSITSISPLIRNRVLARLNLSDSVFMASMDYYMAHPHTLDRIYGALIDSLSLREQRLPNPDAAPR